MARIKKVTPFTQTVRGNQQGTNLGGMFHKDWDKAAGAEQAMVRTAERKAQGQKMTPLGAGKLKGR